MRWAVAANACPSSRTLLWAAVYASSPRLGVTQRNLVYSYRVSSSVLSGSGTLRMIHEFFMKFMCRRAYRSGFSSSSESRKNLRDKEDISLVIVSDGQNLEFLFSGTRRLHRQRNVAQRMTGATTRTASSSGDGKCFDRAISIAAESEVHVRFSLLFSARGVCSGPFFWNSHHCCRLEVLQQGYLPKNSRI